MAIQANGIQRFSDTNQNYDISIHLDKFKNLFEDSDKINLETLNELGELSSNGDENSIDILINIALRQDHIGEKATNILFDLFSGLSNSCEYRDVADIISNKCLFLKKIAKESAKNNKDMKKITQPGKLYYMSANALDDITDETDCAKELSDYFKKYINSQIDETENILSLDRMTNSDELNTGLEAITANEDNVNINYPMPIIGFYDILEDKFNQYGLMNKLDMHLLNVSGNHWVLGVTYPCKADNEHHFVVFNSLENEKNHKDKIIEAVKNISINAENIHFIDGKMQAHTPNGCGLFTLKGAQLITENALRKDPKDVLEQFVREFKNLNGQDQTSFIVNQRRQLMGYQFDKIDKKINRGT